MGVHITVAGGPELERISRELVRRYPEEARKAVRMGVQESLNRTKARGIKLSTAEYTMTAEGKRKVAASVRIRKPGPDELTGEVSFTGKPGTPLRYFRASPKRAVPDLRGVSPYKRRPKEGVKVKVRRAGGFRPARGPRGEKTFWFKKNGAVLLGYRDPNRYTTVTKKGKRKSWKERVQMISTKGLFGASPIQAISKEQTFRELSQYAEDAMRKRIAHQLDRLMKAKG